MVSNDKSNDRKWLSQDVCAAIFLLLLCIVLWIASLQIREPDYGQLSPATWPRIIIGSLGLLSMIFLVQSIAQSRRPKDNLASADNIGATTDVKDSLNNPLELSPSPLHPKAFYRYWKNVFWCFTLFGAYLWSLPFLGMLVGACLFVFLLLTALGGWQPRQIFFHAAIALITVGGMWSLFTFGLGVLLPSGSLFDFR